jgi:hypothetical protein
VPFTETAREPSDKAQDTLHGRYYSRHRAGWENGSQVNVVIPLSTCCANDARGLHTNSDGALRHCLDVVRGAIRRQRSLGWLADDLSGSAANICSTNPLQGRIVSEPIPTMW